MSSGTTPNNKTDLEFERDKVCFEQNSQHFRSLNLIMWQVPIIAMTLTGGLWFGVASFSIDKGFKIILLILACIANLGLIVVLNRVRTIMGCYLDAIKSFSSKSFIRDQGKGFFGGPKAVVRIFRLLLLYSAICSGVGIIFI